MVGLCRWQVPGKVGAAPHLSSGLAEGLGLHADAGESEASSACFSLCGYGVAMVSYPAWGISGSLESLD